MSLPNSVYNQSATPQAQQTANLQQALNQAVASGGSVQGLPSDPQLNSMLGTANSNLVTLNSPGKRQEYITNSDIPAMQGNYDQLARQLFEYDQGVLNPKFAGTDPGLPSDAASFGRVEASPYAMTAQSAALPASQGLSIATNNPKYAYDAQSMQAESIGSLLDIITSGMSKKFGARVDQYASDVKGAQAALDTILKVMQLKQDAMDKAASRGSLSQTEKALVSAKQRLINDAKKGVTFKDLILRYTPDGLTTSEIREAYNGVNYYKKPAKESEQEVLSLIQNGKTSEKKPSVEEQKYVNLGKSGLRTLEQVKNIYENDPDVLTKQMIPGQFFSRDFDTALFNTVDALLRIRTGAQAPESEVRSYMKKLGPTFGDSPEVVQQKLSNLQKEFAAISKEAPKPLQINKKRATSVSGNAAIDLLIGNSARVAQDVGTGIRNIQSRGFMEKNEKLAKELETKASQTKDMKLRKSLLKQANQIREAMSSEAQDISGSFSRDVTANPILRSLLATGELATIAAAPGLASGAKNVVAKGASAAKSNFSFKGIGAKRDAAVAAAKNVKVSGDELVSAAKAYAKDDPLALPILKKILPSIEKKQLTIPELMRKIDVWNDAYTSAGKVGKSAEAGLNNVLARKAKELISQRAPDVAKANKLFQRKYAIDKAGKKAVNASILGGVGGSGYELVRALIGGK